MEKSSPGRPAQRRRTRKAIVEATMELLEAGESPSAADVARAADVSRRTIYLHFPSFEHLLLDATLGLLGRETIDRAIDEGGDGHDVEARLDRAIRAIQRGALESEHLGRNLIRLTIDADAPQPRRGYRRVEWIERVLEPVREELGPERFARLVSALVVVAGWESILALRDMRGLPAGEVEDVAAWSARALLRAALAEAHAGDRA